MSHLLKATQSDSNVVQCEKITSTTSLWWPYRLCVNKWRRAGTTIMFEIVLSVKLVYIIQKNKMLNRLTSCGTKWAYLEKPITMTGALGLSLISPSPNIKRTCPVRATGRTANLGVGVSCLFEVRLLFDGLSSARIWRKWTQEAELRQYGKVMVSELFQFSRPARKYCSALSLVHFHRTRSKT